MSAIPEEFARRLLAKVISENCCADFLECLFEGGSATIDRLTGRLVLAPASVIEQLRDDGRPDDLKAVEGEG